MSQSSTDKLPAAERVTRAIWSLLQRGVRPWTKPWDDAKAGVPVLPRRANGTPYRGVNIVALWAAAQERGYPSPYWLTFKQALALGAQVRKGERGSFVVFYKDLRKAPDDSDEPDAPNADEPRRLVLRGYTVFNRVQIDGLDDRYDAAIAAPTRTEDGLAERFARVPALVRHGGARAYYAIATDHVQLPPRAAFRDGAHYYATLAHELGHWTRHPSRLDRDFGCKRFGDHGYALEELVAELCAAFVGAAIGLAADHIEDHASYIASWLEALEQKPSSFLAAAGKAQAAADYLLRLMGESETAAAPEG